MVFQMTSVDTALDANQKAKWQRSLTGNTLVEENRFNQSTSKNVTIFAGFLGEHGLGNNFLA
jgi:hypothetical protein